MTDTPPAEQDQRQAAVVSDYLAAGFSAEFDGGAHSSGHASQSASELATTFEDESSLKLQGGDIHRDLYKINARARGVQRAQTFSHPQTNYDLEDDESMTATEQMEPQGFRRQYVIQRQRRYNSTNAIPVARNFVEFLDLYGAFAGEDLAESDDEAIEDDSDSPTERRPLLGRRMTSRIAEKGDAGTTRTFFTLLKAFIGTGIMFLPKAFLNGGILFSAVTLILVAVISMLAFHLLLRCRAQYGGGYGELGSAIAGPRMRALILASITLSQLGFVCTGIVFVADNWHSFFQAVTHGANPLGTKALIGIQAAVIVPLAFIRNIAKLGPAAMLADVFIAIGIVYIWYYDVAALASRGIHPSVRLFNPSSYTLTIGASIFTFEGIGLILPIQQSMRKPERFEWLLGVVMLIITCIFTSIGALCYATFGTETQIEIINNYPQDSKLVNAIQFIYAMAVLVGNPVQLFPAMRILENKLFRNLSGKKDLVTKWKKNVFRTFLVALCIAISILGSGNLDRFVALIGSFACVPLVYIYPPWLHYKGVAKSRTAKTVDLVLMALGLVGMVYTTAVTLISSFL